MSGRPGHPAHRCQLCHGDPDWHLTRRGDAVVSWACDRDLHLVADDLLEPGSHRTELVLKRCEATR